MPWQTAVLLLLVAQLAVLSAALFAVDRNRSANRLLAAWLLVTAGLLSPFALGYAGMFRRHEWLTFLPVAVPLAIGPLLWGYAHGLVEGERPNHFARHMALPAVQFGYAAFCFLLPVPIKNGWSAHGHEPWVVPVSSLVSLWSLAAYTLMSARTLRRYRAQLAGERSDDARFAGRWLDRAIGAFWTILGLRIVFQASGIFGGEGSYAVVASFYGLFGLIALYVGIEGWHYAELAYPRFASPVPEAPAVAPGHDWAAMGRQWTEQVRAEGWWREPELDLATIAARLGTNRSHLSSALNDGMGMNFSTFINGLRAEAVAERLRDGDSRALLPLAFEMGFNSKASFNRAFTAGFGMTPTAYRRDVASGSTSQ